MQQMTKAERLSAERFSKLALPMGAAAVLGLALLAKAGSVPSFGELALDPVRFGFALLLVAAAGLRQKFGISLGLAALGAASVGGAMIQERFSGFGLLPIGVAFTAFAVMVFTVSSGKMAASKLAGFAACLVFAPFF